MHPDLLRSIRRFEAGLAAHERLPAQEQAKFQSQLLYRLLTHAQAHSPFWRTRLAGAGLGADGGGADEAATTLAWLPVLTRAELQDNFAAMRARGPGQAAGQIVAAETSGSSGRPVRVEYLAGPRAMMQFAMARRYDAWHGRDVRRPLAVIADVADEVRAGWRPDLAIEGAIGQVTSRNMMASTAEELWDWLAGTGADYLTTTVSMAKALALAALEEAARGGRRMQLVEVMTHGETVSVEARSLVAEAFGGARLTGIYGCQEASWMAMTCPVHDRLHVMSANVVVEIVRPDGAACAPGEAGRVLVTALHSHAMPLVRYELGDVAEWAADEVCDCGVGLPTIARVHGRERSFLRMPDGGLRLARITGEHWRAVAPVEEFRLVQWGCGTVEAFLRCPRPLTAPERAAAAAMLGRVLDPGLVIVVSQVERIDWPASGKRDEVTRTQDARPCDR